MENRIKKITKSMRYKIGQRWKCTTSRYHTSFYFIILKPSNERKNEKICRVVQDNRINSSNPVKTSDNPYTHAHLKKYAILEEGTVEDFEEIVCPYCNKHNTCIILNKESPNNIMNHCDNFI